MSHLKLLTRVAAAPEKVGHRFAEPTVVDDDIGSYSHAPNSTRAHRSHEEGSRGHYDSSALGTFDPGRGVVRDDNQKPDRDGEL